MRVADLMQTDVVVVDADAPVANAVVTLADAHISGLPVLDGSRRLVGVLTTTDVLEAAAEREEAEERESLFERTPVRDIMTPRPVTIGPEADVTEASQQMLYLEVHRLFVEDKSGLVGVISQSDVVRAVATAKL
jgi:CBS domain-containing protein